jgi:rod shape-determining protein MreC
MAIYTVGRRRVILALLLTSALVLTIDLRGNSVVNRARDAMAVVMDPVDSAVGVVTLPFERAWNGIFNYDDVKQQNQELQDQVDQLIGTRAAAEAAVIQSQEILALNNLPSLSGIDTELAKVIGGAANNIDQVIEINKGRSSGIAVGMPVVNQAGLIGKVTRVTENTARVMLVTDTRYAIGVSIIASDGSELGSVTANTTPSGLTSDQVAAAATTTTTSPTIASAAPSTTVPGAPAPLPTGQPDTGTTLPGYNPDTSIPSFIDPVTGRPIDPNALRAIAAGAASTSTTTTAPTVVQKEFGALEGRGQRYLPQVRFVQDNPGLAELKVGDLVETAGGFDDLAPTGIPVGRVANRANRPGSGGPLLDIELYADLNRLNFVRVVLYKPLSEVEQ